VKIMGLHGRSLPREWLGTERCSAAGTGAPADPARLLALPLLVPPDAERECQLPAGEVTLRGRHAGRMELSPKEQSMLATLVTLSRFPILVFVVVTFYRGTPEMRLIGVGVLLLGLLLDTVDGMIARRRRESSLVGSVLDIAADRTYELVLWICFAERGLISMVIPCIVVARTALTDALRSVDVAKGIAPFAQLRSRAGQFLVASSWMRSAYGVSKVVAFCGLALVLAGGSGVTHAAGLTTLVGGTAWVTVGLCVARGVPVIVEGLRRNWAVRETASAA
jgi:phosphatidylglycerophosphate synthase